MIITKFVATKIGGKNIKHYKNLGYKIKLYDVINVPIEHLPLSSHAIIDVECDYCRTKIKKIYKTLINERKHSFTKKDCCCNCIGKKGRETNIEKYGCSNVMQIEEFKENLKNTVLERYGVQFVSQNESIKKRMSDGQKNMSETDKDSRKERTKKTMQERYGVDSPLQMPITRKKLFETRSSASSQQIKIYEMLVKIFGEENVCINFFLSKLSLDIVVSIEDLYIDVEYDSWYWHEPNRDRRRDEFVKAQGFRVLRIKSSKMIPTKDELKEKIFWMVKNNHFYSEIILDDWNQELYEKEVVNECVSNNSI